MSDRTKPARQKHSLSDKKTQWHMAITPAMKLELMEYSQILDYVPERLLNTKALQKRPVPLWTPPQSSMMHISKS